MTKLQDKLQLYIVGGPTASGKTSFALALARKVGGEIVNADSVQIYQGLDIGSNKGNLVQFPEIDSIKAEALGSKFKIRPFEIESSKVVGWMFDVVKPSFNFTVAHYQILALEVIRDIIDRSKVPIVVGGTGLYIDALLNGYEIQKKPDQKQREQLSKLSVLELQKILKRERFDLTSLNNSDLNNPRRLIRYIEKQREQTTSQANILELKETFDITFYYPKFNREELMEKIEERVKKMVDEGLVAEVEELLAQGYSKDLKSMQSTGYKQVIQFLEGEIKTEELVEKIALAHKQYAKRQITWFEGEGRGYDLHKVV